MKSAPDSIQPEIGRERQVISTASALKAAACSTRSE